MKLSKNTGLSLILLTVSLLIINRLIPPSVDPIIAVTLSKNKTHITNIDQTRDITDTENIFLDVINLSNKNRFSHPKLGILGWGEDFFADVNTTFIVNKPGRYRFVVGSDDGFDLQIDNKTICAHKKDRPYRKRNCHLQLSEGEHQLALSYFQGFGNAGLTLEFAASPKGELHYWGEANEAVEYTK